MLASRTYIFQLKCGGRAAQPGQAHAAHLLGKQKCYHGGDEGMRGWGSPPPTVPSYSPAPTPTSSHLPNQAWSVSLMLNIVFFSEKHQVCT